MSIRVMSLAWNYPRGGSEKLVLLALADWADDEGGNIYPSMGKIAQKTSLSEAQARRVVHQLHEDGVLVPEPGSSSSGGAPRMTRRWRIALDKLTPCSDATPRVDETPHARATPCMNATPSTDARDPLHRCARPLAPVQAEPSLPVKNRQKCSAPNAIAFDAETGWQGVEEADRVMWRNAYPAIDVDAQLFAAAAWARANPKNAKGNWRRFITNWLARAQERARPGRDATPSLRKAVA